MTDEPGTSVKDIFLLTRKHSNLDFLIQSSHFWMSLKLKLLVIIETAHPFHSSSFGSPFLSNALPPHQLQSPLLLPATTQEHFCSFWALPSFLLFYTTSTPTQNPYIHPLVSTVLCTLKHHCCTIPSIDFPHHCVLPWNAAEPAIARRFTPSLAWLSAILPRFSVLWAQVRHKNPHEQDFKSGKQRNCQGHVYGISVDSLLVSWGQNQLSFPKEGERIGNWG